jgi:hypothetical protein
MGTNHINKISDELKSRVKSVGFDCQNIEEEIFKTSNIQKSYRCYLTFGR